MGRLFLRMLEGCLYSCADCHAHLGEHDQLVSKEFVGRHGKAYLFNDIVNVLRGPAEERTMITGRHTVVDIICNNCHRVVGWKYEVAHNPSEKYKEGKFVLERTLIEFADWSKTENITDVPSPLDSSSDSEQN